MFAGNAFASSRNPLSVQSSRKKHSKSVVYVHDVDKSTIPVLTTHQENVFASPFAAFFNKVDEKYRKPQTNVSAKAMDFLKNNQFLSSNQKKSSVISGHIGNRKAFADDW